MRHIHISSPENANTAATLYLAEPASDRLLLVMEAGTSNHDESATLAETMILEGWNRIHLVVTKAADAASVAAAINEALSRAAAQLTSTATKPLLIVAVADEAAALATCMAVLQSHRQADLPTIDGIVTVDAFASTNELSTITTDLAQLDTLVTVIAARRSSSEARRSGMSYHRLLQAKGRETHFIVLAENGSTLFQRLADARDSFGREVRWLLDPVHSRNVA